MSVIEIKKLRLISLFAGIGGFELGFEKFADVVWSNEIDKYACQTYKANFPNHNLSEGDIRKIKVEDIPEHDILVGGFPCQTFSVAQQVKEKQGLNDPRGHLFKEILRVLEHHKPKWFLLENVKGLTFKNNKEAFDLIINGLTGLGYKVSWKILNAKNYGVPQSRERIYIIGNLLDIDFKWPKETNTPTTISDVLLKEVDDKYYLSDKAWLGMLERKWKVNGNDKSAFWLLNDEERQKLESGKSMVFSTFSPTDKYVNTLRARYYKDGSEVLIYKKEHKEVRGYIGYSPTLKANAGGLGQPFIFQDRRDHNRASEKANKENVAPTLNGDTSQTPYIYLFSDRGKGYNDKVIDSNNQHPTLTTNSQSVYYISKTNKNNPRKLTPRECARLQGFTDDFKIVVSDCQSYKQFGNAVAVPVIRKLANRITTLNHYYYKELKK